MYLFKTSGETFRSVIDNEAHAFRGCPKSWERGEIVLVSKNRADLRPRERQIEYTMEIRDIRLLRVGEAERFWPGNEGRWKYLVECENTTRIDRPFDLEQVICGAAAMPYLKVMTFKRLDSKDEERVLQHLGKQPGPSALLQPNH